MVGQYEEAIDVLKKALRQSFDNLAVWQGLAFVYILSGRKDEARDAAANIIRIEPKFSLAYLLKILPYKNQTDRGREINALRKAGLN